LFGHAIKIVIVSSYQWSNKLDPHKVPIGFPFGTAATPDDLGRTIFVGSAIQDFGQATPGADDDYGTGFKKTIRHQLHAALAAVVHSGMVVFLGAATSHLDGCFLIFSQK